MPETIRIGAVTCRILSDGGFQYLPGWVFSEPEPGALPPEGMFVPYTCLLIDTGQHKVLVDTGAGNFAPTTGRMPAALEASGLRTEQIDTVILTHGHLDHIGGAVTGDGRPAFEKARYVMSRSEWAFWNAEQIDLSGIKLPEELHTALIATARRCLPPLRPRMEFIEGEGEIVPGVYALPAPGHTPGHLAVAITSGREQLLHLTDSVIHPLHLEHPEWGNPIDLAPDVAQATRQRLLDRAATEDALVTAMHFSSSRAGRVTRRAAGRWGWTPG
jgi:glyoxylase-like metal-dependent hydrolase (beta-lactamase superfamily II)